MEFQKASEFDPDAIVYDAPTVDAMLGKLKQKIRERWITEKNEYVRNELDWILSLLDGEEA